MPFPHRLLQIGTLALFSSMIGGLVLFQCGVFAPEKVPVASDSFLSSEVDSVRLREALRTIKLQRAYAPGLGLVLDDYYFEAARRAAPEVQLAYGDTTFDFYVHPLATEIFLSSFSAEDTAIALKVLDMYDAMGRGLNFWEYEYFGNASKAVRKAFGTLTAEDSLQFWETIKRHRRSYKLPPMTASETVRFQIILDSLTRPRLGSSKSGLIFRGHGDTLQALKILDAERPNE